MKQNARSSCTLPLHRERLTFVNHNFAGTPPPCHRTTLKLNATEGVLLSLVAQLVRDGHSKSQMCKSG